MPRRTTPDGEQTYGLDHRSYEERAAELDADVEAFLASGKKIQIIPQGVSGQDEWGRNKNIVISRRKAQQNGQKR